MIDRVFELLQVLARADLRGLTVTELVQKTGLSKATAHRLISALVEVGFAYQDLNSKRYHARFCGGGTGAVGGGAGFQDSFPAALERLAEATGDTVIGSIREGAAAVCVARLSGSFPIRTLTLDIGDRRPLGVGSGSLAILAALSDDQIEEAEMSRNQRWLQDLSELHEERNSG